MEAAKKEYSDTPKPAVFGNTSPLDPQLFSRINDFVDELLKGERSGKYTPIDVAQWLEDLAAEAKAAEPKRVNLDIAIQAGLGRFFAAKFRSAVLYGIYSRVKSRAALEKAITYYRLARTNWASLADTARGVYLPDVTFGELSWLRGHWLDQLPAIDADISLLNAQLSQATIIEDSQAMAAIAEATGRPRRPSAKIDHRPPDRIKRNEPLKLQLSGPALGSVRLYYRHVNQAERWQSQVMGRMGSTYAAVIPGTFTNSPYPLQYYFELKSAPDRAWLYPGFPANLAGQPYYVVRNS